MTEEDWTIVLRVFAASPFLPTGRTLNEGYGGNLVMHGRTYRFVGLNSWLLLFALTAASPAFAEKRVALVIGNSSYVNVPRLTNPASDAHLMAETLRSLGFTLIGGDAQVDLDDGAIRRAVQAFGNQLQGADVGLFYYAGHGVQVRGANYLVPVGANPTKESDVDFQMLDSNLVLRQMEDAGTKLNLIILDACRNNPFAGRGLRATDAGLAQMRAPEGTLISFATQPNSVAQDGSDGNSPYTKALAQAIRTPGLDIFKTFNQVGLDVAKSTGGLQQPWVSASPIKGDFYFAGEVAPASDHPNLSSVEARIAALEAAQTAKPVPPSTDDVAWVLLKETTDEAALKRFTSRYPNSPLRKDAEARIAALERAEAANRRRFDGNWLGKLVCKTTNSGLPGWSYELTGKVTDGIFHAEIGRVGQPGSQTFDGTIEPDGTADILQKGLSGDSRRDPFHRPAGTEYNNKYLTKFEGLHGSGTRSDRPSCNVNFVKR